MKNLAQFEVWNGDDPSYPIENYSPDGKRFFVVFQQGDLSDNTNRYTLVVWSWLTRDKLSAPATVLTMRSSSNHPAIADARWLSDGVIVFLGESPGERTQVYRFDIKSRSLAKLTNQKTDVTTFDITPDGKHLAYVAARPPGDLFAGQERVGVPVTGQPVYNLLDGKENEWWEWKGDLYVGETGQATRHILVRDGVNAYWTRPVISPDGKHVVFNASASNVPDSWLRYEGDRDLKWVARVPIEPHKYSWLQRYWIVDSSSMQARILLDAPCSRLIDSRASWLTDSRSVVLSGVFLPLNAETDRLRDWANVPYAVEVNTIDSRVLPISNRPLVVKGWDPLHKAIAFTEEKQHPGDHNYIPQSRDLLYFRKGDDGWTLLKPADPAQVARPVVVLSEGINAPPKLELKSETGSYSLLLDLNPQFRDLRFATVRRMDWATPSGQRRSGGLYYPLHYQSGRKYPLVIQTHGWNPNRFEIDGIYSSGYAAQALASKDIFVLEMDLQDSDQDYRGVLAEREALESAIKNLDRDGLIDPNRVGMTGFSVTGVYVKDYLAHSGRAIAAAAVEDENDDGFMQFMLNVNDSPGRGKWYEQINGGLPFGAGLRTWAERSPTFMADNVKTPMRIIVHSSPAVIWEWEWFAAMRLLNKPVEMILASPNGEHLLVKPWERLISQGGNVDWFAFWLEGVEDPDSAKQHQYRRWEALCALQLKSSPASKTYCRRPH